MSILKCTYFLTGSHSEIGSHLTVAWHVAISVGQMVDMMRLALPGVHQTWS